MRFFYEPTILLYHETDGPFPAVNLVDGLLCSIYPTEDPSLYTLSSVPHIPLGQTATAEAAGHLRDSVTGEDLAAAWLQTMGGHRPGRRLLLALEPVPACYGADVLLHAADVRRLVRPCGHPDIRTHLDSACVTLAGDGLAHEIAATGAGEDGLAHYHIAEPGLGPFDSPSCPHAAAGDAPRQAGYGRWLVIEMREQPGGLAALGTAVRLAQQAYGVSATVRLC